MRYVTGIPKYRAKKTIVDGIKFDSQKEATRYLQLKLLERAGAISDLKLQVKYELQPKYDINKRHVRAINYICDFTYIEDGNLVVEDVKGMLTQEYKLKKKLFEYKYGIEIRET